MVKISRREINKAKVLYRRHHTQLKEFDYGFTNFAEFLGMNQAQRIEYYYNKDAVVELTELSASKLRALNASPEYMWTLLKAACAKHSPEES
jgi:hypothetical protein